LEDDCVKIIDLGLGTKLMGMGYGFFGTPTYMPPEVFKKTGYDFKFDVFSIGVIMYTMLACDFPFNDNSFQGLSKKIQETEPDYNRLRLKKVSFEAIELIKNMLQKDKVKRFTIQECLEDKWFTLGHDNLSSTNVMQSVVKEDALVCLQS